MNPLQFVDDQVRIAEQSEQIKALGKTIAKHRHYARKRAMEVATLKLKTKQQDNAIIEMRGCVKSMALKLRAQNYGANPMEKRIKGYQLQAVCYRARITKLQTELIAVKKDNESLNKLLGLTTPSIDASDSFDTADNGKEDIPAIVPLLDARIAVLREEIDQQVAFRIVAEEVAEAGAAAIEHALNNADTDDNKCVDEDIDDNNCIGENDDDDCPPNFDPITNRRKQKRMSE